MSDYDFDLFVIGAGSGGVRASRMSAAHGIRVGIAESNFLGGTCVNVGCVPKKLLVYGSHFHEDFEDASAYGWDVEAQGFDWSRLIENKNTEISRLNGIYRNILDNAGVTLYEARAEFIDNHTLKVGDETITAETILVAVGGWPALPEIPGIEHAISSNEIFFLPEKPKRFVAVGGGFIAVEMAGVMNGFGSETTLLYRGPKILRGFDEDVRDTVSTEIQKKGIDLRTGVNIEKIEKTDDGLELTLTDGSTLMTDQVLYATGRAPKVTGLGLEKAGVKTNAKGVIAVDDYSRTNVPNIYAIGDVTDRVNLTPVAIHEGMAFAATVYGGKPTKVDHENIPSAVFSQPPVGTVGMSEAEAREAFGEVDIYRSTFKPMKHTLTGRDEKTMMKLIVNPATDVVVGAHMVGPEAGEIIQGIGIAVKLGATKAQFDQTVGIHPTAAEEFVTMREKV